METSCLHDVFLTGDDNVPFWITKIFPRYVGSQVLQDAGTHRPHHEFTEGGDRTTLEPLRTVSRSSVVAQLFMSSSYWKVSARRLKQMPGDRKDKRNSSSLHAFGASYWAECGSGHGWALKHERPPLWSRWTDGPVWQQLRTEITSAVRSYSEQRGDRSSRCSPAQERLRSRTLCEHRSTLLLCAAPSNTEFGWNTILRSG